MDSKTQNAVRLRAAGACECCRTPMFYFRERFSFDHIIARQHGGQSTLENLAFCCMRCNRHKGSNLAGCDPTTGDIVLLFNPRIDVWSEHFEWQTAILAGRTPRGRATVSTLNMNAFARIASREELRKEGLFPPPLR